MTDDQQRARAQFEAWATGEGFSVARIGGQNYNDIAVHAAWDAWNAALRAAPEGFVLVPVEPTTEMVEAFNRRDELPYPEKNRRAYKAIHCYAALLAARPQGVKDRPPIDGCTESNCKRCRTHPNHRGDMEHAGIGWRPDNPQEASDAN